jgi:preprotein translocase subunit SecG
MIDKLFPPTDNLYKFSAIAGLLFIILSFYPQYLNFKLNEQKIENMKNSKILMTDLKLANEELELLRKKHEETNQSKEGNKPTDEELSKYIQKRKELESRNIEIESVQELEKYYNEEINRLNFISHITFSVGILVMLIGFYLWYQKVQKPSDLILTNQTKENLTKNKRKLAGRPTIKEKLQNRLNR